MTADARRFLATVARFTRHALLLAGLIGHGVASAGEPVSMPIPVALKRDLQVLLDRYGSIRLDANADYRSRALSHLLVSSGQRIVGGWNTRVPQMLIPGGASKVTIRGVRSDSSTAPDIVFTGGEPNNDVEIVGGSGGPGTLIRVHVRSAARINRLDLSAYGGLVVSQADAGYVRDSLFAAMLGHSPGPHIDWQGNLREPSRGNAFMGLASITPGHGSSWKNAGDLWMVGWDCESLTAIDGGPAECFTLEGSSRIVSVGLSGGTAYPERAGALASFRDTASLVSWFQHGHGGRLDGADVILDNVGSVVSVQKEDDGGVQERATPAGAARVRLFGRLGSLQRRAVGAPAAKALDAAQRATIAASLVDVPRPIAFSRPMPRPLDDALGPMWRDRLAVQPDAAPRIQTEIDAKGIVELPAGIYYLDRPLKLGDRARTEGLLGVDRDAVYLVAKGDFPVIEGRGEYGDARHPDERAVITLVLAGLTIYGGTYGIHWSGAAGNLGPGATVAWSSFEDLKFMRQSIAGVGADGIHGLDSNLWHRVDFKDMPVAFRGNGNGAALGMTYADKQHFLDCQYQDISDTVWYWTSDRASGGEIWKDNYFLRVGRLSQTRAANNLLWLNSVMDDVTGPVAIHVTDAGSTATYYFYVFDCLWRGAGPQVVTDTQSWQVGTLFVDTEFAQAGGSIVASTGDQTLWAWGSRITGSAALGSVGNGLFVDSPMGGFDRRLLIVEGGRVTTSQGTAVAPVRRASTR